MTTTYQGFDVLEVMPSDDGSRSADLRRTEVRIDSNSGPVEVVDVSGITIVQPKSFVWVMDGRGEVADYQTFIAARRGALVPFWAPTWRTDLFLNADYITGTTIAIQSSGYTDLQFIKAARRYLAFLPASGNKYYRKVLTSVVDGGGATETLTIDSLVPEPLPKGTMISFLTLCRLVDDEPELAWQAKDVAIATLDFMELPREVPA